MYRPCGTFALRSILVSEVDLTSTVAVVFDLSGGATDFARKLKEIREADGLNASLLRVEGFFPPTGSGLSGRLTLFVRTDPPLTETQLRERIAVFVPPTEGKGVKVP